MALKQPAQLSESEVRDLMTKIRTQAQARKINAMLLKSDELNNIIDTRGNIINTNKLFSSKVLRIYHNSPMLSGIPLFALRKVLTNTRTMQVSR